MSNQALQAQRDAILGRLSQRYRSLKQELHTADIRTLPFNSGFFALIPAPDGNPEALRQRLLAQGVGVIAWQSARAIRIVYSSIRDEAVPPLVARLKTALI